MGNLTSNATSSQSLARTVADILGIGELVALARAALELSIQQHLHVSGLQARSPAGSCRSCTQP